MNKFLVYILIFLFSSSCIEILKPFEEDKNNNYTIIEEDIFISKIVGLNKNQENELKKNIYKNFTDKNILSSYKFSNKNSNTLSAKIIKYSNHYKIIWKLYNPTEKKEYNFDFKINIKNINDNFNLLEITNDISNAIEKLIVQNKNIIYIKINEINNINSKNKDVFINNLVTISNNYRIKYLFNSDKNQSNFNLNINFMFSEISQSETKLKINWIVRDMNNIIIGNIEQERVISKNLIKNLWPQISKKIIEMAIIEINYLINL